MNKSKSLKNARAWKTNNPLKNKNSRLKCKYGITITQFKTMLKRQDRRCAICRKRETSLDHRTKKVRDLAVDHCHATQKVRGLLCGACNKAIGLIKENPKTAINIAIYLHRYNK